MEKNILTGHRPTMVQTINRDGKRMASGVYMVEVATSEGEKGVVCKIAIVR